MVTIPRGASCIVSWLQYRRGEISHQVLVKRMVLVFSKMVFSKIVFSKYYLVGADHSWLLEIIENGHILKAKKSRLSAKLIVRSVILTVILRTAREGGHLSSSSSSAKASWSQKLPVRLVSLALPLRPSRIQFA